MSEKPKVKEEPNVETNTELVKFTNQPDVSVTISPSGAVLTPRWFWRDYIDSQTVPRHQVHQLIRAAGLAHAIEFSSPLSVRSKLCVVRTSNNDLVARDVDLSLGVPDHNVLNIIDISRHRKFRPVSKTFSIGGMGDSSTQKYVIYDKELESEASLARRTCHDFELVWKPLSANLNVSTARYFITEESNILEPYQVLAKAVRQFWHDNLELQVESKFFHVDRYVFTRHANNFADCCNLFLQIPVHKVQMGVLTRLYGWMLDEKSELLIEEQLVPMFISAKFLGVRELIEQYWHTFSISGDLGLWEQDAFHAYLAAREHRCEEMMALMLTRVRKMFLPLVASLEFLQLEVNEVAYLLRQDTLCVNSEDEVFFAAIRWLDYKWPSRKESIATVMASVRFRHLAPWIRRSICCAPENAVLKEVGHTCQVVAFLWDAAKFCLAAINFESPHHARCPIIRKYRNEKCDERFWVYCPGVPHHHDVKCPRFRELTYETFNLHLVRVQNYAVAYAQALKYVPNKFWNTYHCCKDQDLKSPDRRKCPRPPVYVLEEEHD
ncbi:uncharacterized protein LOC115629631 [Scaptodrosophila lebanonensis]|uniref:Uncharacterized protein LOC115629631 n=1 Tax=Drosophila lebanonensis TaxID=7225 RepID=A0A6J2U4D4_DROLE|nr:uncharacterized protein LOC115629631 [Scaptodrosophila lebanonensis]